MSSSGGDWSSQILFLADELQRVGVVTKLRNEELELSVELRQIDDVALVTSNP